MTDQSRTPRTESGNWPTPEHTQRIQFEGCECAVMSPEDYEALYESHRTLELEAADLRERLAKAREDAIEECARVCESQVLDPFNNAYDNGRKKCAEEIRALKQKGADHE